MSKKHDENRDLRLIGKIGKVNPSDKTINVSRGTVIGIHMWAKLDYLTHYCGYTLVWNGTAVVTKAQIRDEVSTSSVKSQKKIKNEFKISEKIKREKSNKYV